MAGISFVLFRLVHNTPPSDEGFSLHQTVGGLLQFGNSIDRNIIHRSFGYTHSSPRFRSKYFFLFCPLYATQAVAGEDYIVYAYFHDGTVRRFDAKPLIEQGGVFLPLQDEDFSRTHLTVLNDAVAWDMDGTRDPVPALISPPVRCTNPALSGSPPPRDWAVNADLKL